MIALSGHLRYVLLACAVLAQANANAGDDAAYRAWVKGRARAAQALAQPADAAVAATLLQNLCNRDTACFPEARWHALAKRARRTEDPAVLTMILDIASYHDDEASLASQWAQVAARDPNNAFPLIMQAGAEWHAGRHEQALETLRAVPLRPRDDDHSGDMLRLMRPVIDAEPPTLEQTKHCFMSGLEYEPPSSAELRAAVLMEMVSDTILPKEQGYIHEICSNISAQDSERRDACLAAGEHLAQHATSRLGRDVGLTMQRLSSADPSRRDAINQQELREADELLQKLWWQQQSPDAARRDAATEYWLDEIARVGEIAANDSLNRRFGQPPSESREERDQRVDRHSEKARACYFGTENEN